MRRKIQRQTTQNYKKHVQSLFLPSRPTTINRKLNRILDTQYVDGRRVITSSLRGPHVTAGPARDDCIYLRSPRPALVRICRPCVPQLEHGNTTYPAARMVPSQSTTDSFYAHCIWHAWSRVLDIRHKTNTLHLFLIVARQHLQSITHRNQRV